MSTQAEQKHLTITAALKACYSGCVIVHDQNPDKCIISVDKGLLILDLETCTVKRTSVSGIITSFDCVGIGGVEQPVWKTSRVEFSFPLALAALKRGACVARRAWAQEAQHDRYVAPTTGSPGIVVEGLFGEIDDKLFFTSFSIFDVMANDWYIVSLPQTTKG